MSKNYLSGHNKIQKSLIILDDIICSEDILKRTSEIIKLSFSGRHEGILLIIITHNFYTAPKKSRRKYVKINIFL